MRVTAATPIGLSVRLHAELDAPAAHLRLPGDIDLDGEGFDKVAANGEPWQRYPAAGRACAVLRAMARASLEHRA